MGMGRTSEAKSEAGHAAVAPWTRRHMASHMFQDGRGQIQLMCRGMRQGVKLTRRFGAGINSERSNKGRSWTERGRPQESRLCCLGRQVRIAMRGILAWTRDEASG